jgi:hypothetical protein
MATAGGDAKVAIWTSGRQQPDRVFEGHTAPIVSLAVSPDGARLASASWDHTVRIWSLGDGAQRVLEGHAQNVNGVAFMPDGRSLVSVGYDRELRIWPLVDGTPNVITLGSPLNAVAVSPDGEIVTGGADGKLRFLMSEGQERGEMQAGQTPIVALAISPDGTSVAAAGIGGVVAVIDRKTQSIARTLVDPGSGRLVGRFSAGQRNIADGWRRRQNPTLECADWRTHRLVVAGHATRSTCRLCGRSRRRSVQGVRCLSHPVREGRATRRPHACGLVRPQDRIAAWLSFLRRAQRHGHRVDARDRVKIVRTRSERLHSWHKNAGAADRICG